MAAGLITRRTLGTLAVAATLQQGEAQSPFGSMLWDYIREYLRLLEEHRAKRLAALSSAEDFASLRQRVREELVRMWGAFPPRTPLHPRQIGVLERDDHIVEKILFDSRPSFHVTANLYRPKGVDGPLPAIVFTCGHTGAGKAEDSYQRFAILMARLRFVVLIWDPLGQGERLQLFGADTENSAFGAGTGEQRVLGHQCYLLGRNLMHYLAWDVTRALDYLELRPDVDSGRMAIAGQSGGGTVALQFACFDDRIQAAFLSGAVASLRAKAEALLLADPAQVLYGTLRAGIDHPELLAAFAPKPLLIGASVRDSIPIDGVRRTHEELQHVYRKLDAAANLQLVVSDTADQLSQELREAAADFFLRTLGRREEPVRDVPANLASVEDLFCTSTGQVSTALQSKTVSDLNTERARAIAPKHAMPKTASEFEGYRSQVANRIREITRVGAYRSEYGIEVPSRFLDAGVYAKGAVFLAAEQGKDHPLVRRYVIDAIVAANHSLYGLDLRGWGATTASLPEFDVSFEWDDFFAYRCLELGRPLFGQRLKDLLATAPKLTKRREWILVGVGMGGLLAAHAAALDPRVAGMVSIGAPLSYRSIFDDPRTTQPVSCLLPGVLGAYEISDVYASVAPRPLLIVNPEDSRRRPVAADAAREACTWPLGIYGSLDVADGIRIESGLGQSEIRALLGEWLRSVSG